MSVTAAGRRAAAAPDSTSDSRWVDEPDALPPSGQQWRAWLKRHRLALLLGMCLAAVLLVLVWLRVLAAQPVLPGSWELVAAPPGGSTSIGLRLADRPSADHPLDSAWGDALVDIRSAAGQRLAASAAWLPRPVRWITDDAEREAYIEARARLDAVLAHPPLQLGLASGRTIELSAAPRGLAELGPVAWALAGLALALVLAAGLVLVSQPSHSNLLYGGLALLQCGALLLCAQDSVPGIGMQAIDARTAWSVRVAIDAASLAALIHLLLRAPRRWPQARPLTAGAWTAAGILALWAGRSTTPGAWWWIDGAMLATGALSLLLLRRGQQVDRHPVAAGFQGLVAAGGATLLLLTIGLGVAPSAADIAPRWTSLAPVLWTVFVAALLMLGPFLARAGQPLREFALLAGFGTAAMSLHLVTSTLLPAHPTAAWALTLGLALLVYGMARPVLASRLSGSSRLSAEHLFDGLYRTARAVQQSPQLTGDHLSRLLREVFDPISIQRKPRSLTGVRLAGDGTALAVPVPGAEEVDGGPSAPGTLLLHHARQGRRLFTEEDRRLTERMLEQLRTAVAYDQAVERGRLEERTRIAQDLHDDIGARLLTLMYKAPNSEIEEYIRHTLQDLKTLTRGLASANPRLAHAAAEWKADLAQRLNPTGCDLRWSFSSERDLTLNVVQWSALTRVLRELVNNIISHAQASLVEVNLHFDGRNLSLVVTDDGVGRSPEAWAHGLGLGGVRKRVKQLNGQVRWREAGERGIRCEIELPLVGGAR